jgi:hypothetical protein
MTEEDRRGWYYRALDAVAALFNGGEKTGEELYDMVAAVIGEAPNPAVWGRVVAEVVRKKLIARTGERVAMKHKASHGRSTDVYRRVRLRRK